MKRRTADLLGTAALETPGAWLAWAEQCYSRENLALGQVATNAHDEALYLILHALQLPLDSDARVLNRRLSRTQREVLHSTFKRRIMERTPAAYLTREAWLGAHRFYVDERVIIPRSYFLELIPSQLERWLPRGGEGCRVVDVCTGSGCLAILVAHHFRRARVDACDLSAGALEVAKINVDAHQLAGRVRLFQSDLFAAVPPGRYDVILSNPPYEPSGLVDTQPPEFAAEPRMAHDGGSDGLAIIRRMLRQASVRLQPAGVMMIEVGGLRRAIEREFAALAPQWLSTADGTNCVVLIHAERLTANVAKMGG